MFWTTNPIYTTFKDIPRTFPGQTFVQKWLLDYDHFYGLILPFSTLMGFFSTTKWKYKRSLKSPKMANNHQNHWQWSAELLNNQPKKQCGSQSLYVLVMGFTEKKSVKFKFAMDLKNIHWIWFFLNTPYLNKICVNRPSIQMWISGAFYLPLIHSPGNSSDNTSFASNSTVWLAVR